MYELRASQDDFFSRVHRDRPHGLSARSLSDVPLLHKRAKRLDRSAPTWAKSVIKNTFIGFSARPDQYNIGVNAIGAPSICIEPMMFYLAQAAIGIRTAVLATVVRALGGLGGLMGDDWWSKSQEWRRTAAWFALPRELLSDDPDVRERSIAALEELVRTMPREQQILMDKATQQLFSIAIGHEYGHILLGHVKGAHPHTISEAEALVTGMDAAVVNQESQCDLIGVRIGIELPQRIGKGKATHRLDAILGGVDGALAMMILFTLLSPRSLWADLGQVDDYPSPSDRLQVMLGSLKSETMAIVEECDILDHPDFADSVERRLLDRIDAGIEVESLAMVKFLSDVEREGFLR